jgi:hypothetical protein
VKFNLNEEAFTLAESFKDLNTLVDLTLTHANVDLRIKKYMGMFEESFAVILFQTYINNGK